MTLLINDKFDQRVVIRPNQYCWRESPMPGVQRVMLDRIGGEVARATSIVKYQPNSLFSAHVHTGGEEFLVLEGVFADEHGEYKKGSYVRNPIGTAHAPKIGSQGATILVKLQQFDGEDTEKVNININECIFHPGLVKGLSVLPLHQHKFEHVAIVKWAPHTNFKLHKHWGGEEIYVIEGTFYDEHGCYPKGTWLRNPHLSVHKPYTRDDGCLIWVKTGHIEAL